MNRLSNSQLARLLGGIAMLTATALLWGGGLYLEVGSANGNAEASSLNAALVARITACKDPKMAHITAHAVRRNGTSLERVELRVVPLPAAGQVAVLGDIPAGSIVDLAVTHPEFPNYRPRVLLRTHDRQIQWATVKRYFSTPPTESELQRLLN